MRYFFGVKNSWFVFVSFLIAMMLEIFPLPSLLNNIRPECVLLVLLYWVIVLPAVRKVWIAFLVGILLDFLHSSPLGIHSIAVIVVIYLMMKLRQRMQIYSLFHQSLIIAALIFIYQFIIVLTYKIFGLSPYYYWYWLSILSSTLLWPWFYILMHDIRRCLNMYIGHD